MIRVFEIVVFVIFYTYTADGNPDLTPEALTVYRNPNFFKNLNYGVKANYNEKSAKVPQAAVSHAKYKYPGETKKSNPPASLGFEINYDNSPEFHHEPRDIFVGTTFKPNKKKGPYALKHHNEENSEVISNSNIQKPVQGKDSEEEENQKSKENESEEQPRALISVLNKNLDEEFRVYDEPILLARPNFDTTNSAFASSTYSKPYSYNRTSPVPYEDWKFYTYPKIHANEHLRTDSDSKIYSEEPPSNFFDDEFPTYDKYDEETEDGSNFFESNEFRDSGSDTKHIYKKLLKPKSFLFKFHSKPKLKKLKFKLKKKNLHNTDWFDEYPFDF